MATWGDFIGEINVTQLTGGKMVVPVDDAITLWEERNNLRAEVARLRAELAAARDMCAREVEEFAQACEEESETAVLATAFLRAAAALLREENESPPDEPM